MWAIILVCVYSVGNCLNGNASAEEDDILSPLRTSFTRQRSLIDKPSNQITSNNHVNTHLPLIRLPSTDSQNRPKYEIAYGQLLRSSSKLWKDVQKDFKEHGTTDEKKMTALQIIF